MVVAIVFVPKSIGIAGTGRTSSIGTNDVRKNIGTSSRARGEQCCDSRREVGNVNMVESVETIVGTIRFVTCV